MKKRTEWTKEKLQEIKHWQIDNGKTTKETAKHFGVSVQAIYSATNYYKQNKTDKRKPKFIDIEQAPLTATQQFMAIMIPTDKLTAVLKALQ